MVRTDDLQSLLVHLPRYDLNLLGDSYVILNDLVLNIYILRTTLFHCPLLT
jgi:hypothetical protein